MSEEPALSLGGLDVMNLARKGHDDGKSFLPLPSGNDSSDLCPKEKSVAIDPLEIPGPVTPDPHCQDHF